MSPCCVLFALAVPVLPVANAGTTRGFHDALQPGGLEASSQNFTLLSKTNSAKLLQDPQKGFIQLAIMGHSPMKVFEHCARLRNWDNKFEDYNEPAERGDAKAQYELGLLYLESIHFSYLKGAEDPPKCHGSRIEQSSDYAKAMTWFQKSAKQGFAPAHNQIGILYRDGRGVTVDNLQAYIWFTLGEKNGVQKRRNTEPPSNQN